MRTLYFVTARPCASEYTLPISINYWDTTGFVCFFGNDSAYIEVQIVDFFFLFMYLFHSILVYCNCQNRKLLSSRHTLLI